MCICYLASCCFIHLWSTAKQVDGAFSRPTQWVGITRSSLQSSGSDLQLGISSTCADFLISTSSSSSWFNFASKARSSVYSTTCRNTINKQLCLLKETNSARMQKKILFPVDFGNPRGENSQRWCISSYMAFDDGCKHKIVTNLPPTFLYSSLIEH